MERRFIAAAVLALALQGCYRPMYAPPYSSQGYPIGGGYPGSMYTTPQGQPYMPGGSIPPSSMPLQNGGPTMYNNNNATPYNPAPGAGPSAVRPVPMYGDTPSANNDFQQPTTNSGVNPIGYAAGDGFTRSAGAAPSVAPNEFPGAGAIPLTGSAPFPQPAPTPAPTITSDNFEGGNAGPTSFN
jgi:hypothetical protein